MLSPGQIRPDHVFQMKKPFASLSKPMAEVERSRRRLGFCPQSYVKCRVISDFGASGKEASIRINLLTSNITANKHKLKSLSKCMTQRPRRVQLVRRFQNSTESKINQNNLDVSTGQLGPTLILEGEKKNNKTPEPNILARLHVQFSDSW